MEENIYTDYHVPEQQLPMISCIMPTANRAEYVYRAVQCFFNQDYPHKELIIVYNRGTDLPDGWHDLKTTQTIPGVQLVQVSTKVIGAKRNEACRRAEGSIISHWDDDDINNYNRLSVQVEPILSGECDIVGLTNYIFYDEENDNGYITSPELTNKIFNSGVATSQFIYNRMVWDKYAQYPNLSLGEDLDFLFKAIKMGARAGSVDARSLYIYVRHAVNAWDMKTEYDADKGWIPVNLPRWINPQYQSPAGQDEEDIEDEYDAESDARELEELMALLESDGYPLVSCVVPTAGRPAYLAQSLYYFMIQDYPNKELIIVYNNNNDLPVEWREIYLPANVKLVKTAETVLGAKRNLGCQYAEGAIIAQWDDDDFYGEERLTQQSLPIIADKAEITGVGNFVFYEIATGKGYMAKDELFRNMFRGTVACGTLVYNRKLWDDLAKYQQLNAAEDYHFMLDVLAGGARLKTIDGQDLFAYLRHHNNTWKFEEGNFRHYTGWYEVDLPQWIEQYTPLYAELSRREGQKQKRAMVAPY